MVSSVVGDRRRERATEDAHAGLELNSQLAGQNNWSAYRGEVAEPTDPATPSRLSLRLALAFIFGGVATTVLMAVLSFTNVGETTGGSVGYRWVFLAGEVFAAAVTVAAFKRAEGVLFPADERPSLEERITDLGRSLRDASVLIDELDTEVSRRLAENERVRAELERNRTLATTEWAKAAAVLQAVAEQGVANERRGLRRDVTIAVVSFVVSQVLSTIAAIVFG